MPQSKEETTHDTMRFFNLVPRSTRICDRCSQRHLRAYRVSSFVLFNLSAVGLKESSLILLFSLCFSFVSVFLYADAHLRLFFSKKKKKKEKRGKENGKISVVGTKRSGRRMRKGKHCGKRITRTRVSEEPHSLKHSCERTVGICDRDCDEIGRRNDLNLPRTLWSNDMKIKEERPKERDTESKSGS